MNGRPFGRLDVEADLQMDVDGTRAYLHGRGSQLTLSSSHPERVWAAAVASVLPAGLVVAGGPRAVGRIADQLSAHGVRLDVTGPQGVLASLGAGVSSPLGLVATGSRAVRPGRPVALTSLAWRARPRELAALGAAVVAAALVRRTRRG